MNKGTPYQSCLEPFEDEIVSMRRRKRPVSCAKIAKYMQEKHQITVTRQAIYEFLKIRAKGFKSCQYAWSIEVANAANQLTTEVPSVSAKPETTVSAVHEKTQKQPVTEKPIISEKPTALEKPTTSENPETHEVVFKPFEMKFSETYNLTRMSPEEAAIKNKIIEQKIWEKYHKHKQPKENQ